jgi:hypothetical protein
MDRGSTIKVALVDETIPCKKRWGKSMHENQTVRTFIPACGVLLAGDKLFPADPLLVGGGEGMGMSTFLASWGQVMSGGT